MFIKNITLYWELFRLSHGWQIMPKGIRIRRSAFGSKIWCKRSWAFSLMLIVSGIKYFRSSCILSWSLSDKLIGNGSWPVSISKRHTYTKGKLLVRSIIWFIYFSRTYTQWINVTDEWVEIEWEFSSKFLVDFQWKYFRSHIRSGAWNEV